MTLNSSDNEYLLSTLDGLGTSENSGSFDIGDGVCELTEGDFIELKEDEGSNEDDGSKEGDFIELKEDDGSKEGDGSKEDEDEGSNEGDVSKEDEDEGSKEGLNIVKFDLFMLSFLFGW